MITSSFELNFTLAILDYHAAPYGWQQWCIDNPTDKDC